MGYAASRAKQKASGRTGSPSKSGSISSGSSGRGRINTNLAKNRALSNFVQGLHPSVIKAQQKLSDTYGIKTYTPSGSISTSPTTSKSTWKSITSQSSGFDIVGVSSKETYQKKQKQQVISDLHGVITFDDAGEISTEPSTDPTTWSGEIVSNSLVGSPNEKTAQTLREKVEAKNKATEEFKAKWHGIKENGVIVAAPTATRTDAVQALLTSNNQHFGTDTRNLKEYLTERDYDVSAIIAGEQIVPDDIFKPKKQTEYRELSQQLTTKLDQISNYERAKGKNALQRNVSYAGITGSEYFQIKEEIKVIEDQLESDSGFITAEILKKQDEDTVRAVVDPVMTVSSTPQNIARTTKGTTPKKEVSIPIGFGTSRDIIPLILIAFAGVIGVYLVMRKLK